MLEWYVHGVLLQHMQYFVLRSIPTTVVAHLSCVVGMYKESFLCFLVLAPNGVDCITSVVFICVSVCVSAHSAGVGRSGTFIAVDAMMQRLKEKDEINIYEFLYSMRCDRPFMIQNVVSCKCLSNAKNVLRAFYAVCMYVRVCA